MELDRKISDLDGSSRDVVGALFRSLGSDLFLVCWQVEDVKAAAVDQPAVIQAVPEPEGEPAHPLSWTISESSHFPFSFLGIEPVTSQF